MKKEDKTPMVDCGELTKRRHLRQEKLNQRQNLSPEERQRIGAVMARRLLALYPIQKAQRLMAFVPLPDELDLDPFLQCWLQEGRQLWLPRVGPEQNLEAVPFTSWKETALGRFGVREPLGPAADPREVQVILVPGLVFDPQGYRLGYGRAYYDRFLAPLPESIFTCGVAYEFQIAEQTWPQPHDVAVDWIITERSEIAVNMDFF